MLAYLYMNVYINNCSILEYTDIFIRIYFTMSVTKNGKVKAAIIGANGYTGLMLMRLLGNHKDVELIAAASRSEQGNKISSLYPALSEAYKGMEFCAPDSSEILKADVCFTALPHAAAAEKAGFLADKGLRVVDLSADFRYDDLPLYESVYGVKHPRPELNKTAVYGLTEVNRKAIAAAQIVGNPGCYTTSAILPLYPLLKKGLVKPDGIIIDAKSGVSGAGRKGDVAYSFCETDDNFKAYGVFTHRHTSEIEEKLGIANKLIFTPHLLPVKRGILSTIYVDTVARTDEKSISDAYSVYDNERFVSVTGGSLPQLNWVRGSNRCIIGYKLNAKTGKLIIVSVIDNLIKGASGQALQNMNVMFGLDEGEGLPLAEHL